MEVKGPPMDLLTIDEAIVLLRDYVSEDGAPPRALEALAVILERAARPRK